MRSARSSPLTGHYQGSASAAEPVAAHANTAGLFARGGGCLALGLGQQQKATFALLATGQSHLASTAQTRSALSPQSGSCRQQAVAAGLCQCARQTGGCPGRNCLAACGVGGRGADGGQSMYGFGQDTWQFFGNSSRSPRPALSLSPVLPLTGRCIGNGNLPTLTPSRREIGRASCRERV